MEDLELLLDSTGEGICRTDSHGILNYINKAGATLLGYAPQELIGRPAHATIHYRKPDGSIYREDECPIVRAYKEGRATHCDSDVFWRKDQQPIPVSYSAYPIEHHDALQGIVVVFRDISEQRAIQRTLRETKECMEDILGSIADGFIALDHQWRFTYLNHRAEEILRRSQETLIGRSIWEELPDTAHTELRHEFERAMKQGVRVDSTMLYAPLNAWLEFRASPYAGGLSVLIHDITHRRQMNEEIRRLNADLEKRVAVRTEQLESAYRELEAFSYSVSHDLRAPLRTIAGFSQILMEDCRDSLNATSLRYLDAIQQAATSMSQLIEDLLKLSRVAAGEIARREVNLSKLSETLVRELSAADPARVVEWDIQPGITAYADPNLMRILLDNLLRNAWKFTRDTPLPRIEAGAFQSNSETVYYVRDNGIGFDMSYAHKLFIPFQRLHSASQYEGSGIGLATAKRIVERHGGRIWTDSAPNQTTTFYFTLGKPS